MSGPAVVRDAISLWQPWATEMALGFKTIETRSWQPRSLRSGTWVAIHASKRWTPEQESTWRRHRTIFLVETGRKIDVLQPPLGAVVAVGRFAEALHTGRFTEPPWIEELPSLEQMLGDYTLNRYGWRFGVVVPIKPVPCRGAQGLFTLPADVSEIVARRAAEAIREREAARQAPTVS
jgi:activating signal cointegrator 1